MALLTFAGIPAAQHADAHPKRPGQQPPNIVLIHLDDMGYGDLTATGATGYRTPNIDRLCAEGMRFTNYYSAQAVSSASRAGLLTGCYPNRIGFAGALGPKSKTGLNPDEETMAENLKKAGYATAIVGKWHVGCRPGLMPLDHGFDEYFGLPYSNDMWPHHPQTSSYPPLPLYEGRKVVNPSVSAADQAQLTTRYTEHAVDFITRRSEGPFFLYLAHSMPHVPLFVSDKFKGKSEQGLYGDVMMEIDWSVGEVLKALEKSGAENGLFTLLPDFGESRFHFMLFLLTGFGRRSLALFNQTIDVTLEILLARFAGGVFVLFHGFGNFMVSTAAANSAPFARPFIPANKKTDNSVELSALVAGGGLEPPTFGL